MEKRRKRFPTEVKERAVRMVMESEGDHDSQWAAIRSIASKIDCTPETLRTWVRQAERDAGKRAGLTTSERDRLRELERENRELKRANEILRKASVYFVQAELDRRQRTEWRSTTSIVGSTGSSRSAGFCRSPRRPTSSSGGEPCSRRRSRSERSRTRGFRCS